MMVKLNKAQRREASDIIEAVSSGNVELETYAFELVGLRARVAELEALSMQIQSELNAAIERACGGPGPGLLHEEQLAKMINDRDRRVAELDRDNRIALAEADALREVIKWMWRRCKIVLWPRRWTTHLHQLPPAYPLEHDESARKDSREAIEREMRQELAALRGEDAP